ncbi:glycosyltransferase family 4 protein [Patescibacteria group bacterium]|nr:glycosyltransferase family 4 protein [Patescibacteria group bacterium]
MKICIFHNLKKGGALKYLIEISRLLRQQHSVHIFSFQKNIPKQIYDKINVTKLRKTNNIFGHLYQVLFELKHKSKKIAYKINQKKYDLILIHHCYLTQSPYILKYLKNKKKCIYIFHEPKREFYEPTSSKHFTYRKKITRLIRSPIKFIDKNNCKFAKNIVTNSYYSKFIIKKIYKKKSFVLYPGLNKKQFKLLKTNNQKNFISIGNFTTAKGHDQSIDLLRNTKGKLTIIGKKDEDYKFISNLSNSPKISVSLKTKIKNKNKIKLLKKHTFYFSNQTKEPFGIATLEATTQNCFVLGNNSGGTPEIIQHGLNGFLYPNNHKIKKKIVKSFLEKKKIHFINNNEINWKQTTKHLLSLYHHLKNEPTE